MEFGLMTEPQMGGTYTELLGLARYAESAGLAVFARSDHYLSGRREPHATDAFATLGGLARDTEGIRLAVLVSPISFRHPAVIAKTAATIHEMSDGRLSLGVGAGWMQLEHDAFGLRLPPLAERFARLEEALAYLKAAFGDGDQGYSGTYYQLERVNVKPKPSGMPIIVGGGGSRRTPTLAGRYADEYNLFIEDPATVRARVGVARDAAEAVGREPGALVVSMMTPAVTGANESSYRAVLETEARKRDLSADEFESQLRARHIPHGSPPQVREAVSALAEAGVDVFYLQLLDPLDEIETGRLTETLTVLRS